MGLQSQRLLVLMLFVSFGLGCNEHDHANTGDVHNPLTMTETEAPELDQEDVQILSEDIASFTDQSLSAIDNIDLPEIPSGLTLQGETSGSR